MKIKDFKIQFKFLEDSHRVQDILFKNGYFWLQDYQKGIYHNVFCLGVWFNKIHPIFLEDYRNSLPTNEISIEEFYNLYDIKSQRKLKLEKIQKC